MGQLKKQYNSNTAERLNVCFIHSLVLLCFELPVILFLYMAILVYSALLFLVISQTSDLLFFFICE